MSGAQLANLVNEAGMKCIKDGRKKISSDDIEWAKDKMLLGAEFKSRQFSDEERAVTTWHEAGHLYVGHRHPHSHPVYKATNVPRGKTLGVVHRIPDGDISMQTMAHLKADLAVGMAGRVAEELIFGKENVSTGAQGDFQQANNIAHAMVFQSGMCSELRPYFIDAQQGLSNVASPQTQQYLDEEKQKILAEAKETAKTMITEGWDDFVAVALLLDEKETLDANDIAEVLGENVKAAPLKPNLIHPDLRMEA
jgi:cell division protease FtsH